MVAIVPGPAEDDPPRIGIRELHPNSELIVSTLPPIVIAVGLFAETFTLGSLSKGGALAVSFAILLQWLIARHDGLLRVSWMRFNFDRSEIFLEQLLQLGHEHHEGFDEGRSPRLRTAAELGEICLEKMDRIDAVLERRRTLNWIALGYAITGTLLWGFGDDISKFLGIGG